VNEKRGSNVRKRLAARRQSVSVKPKRGSNAREQSERSVKKESGSSANKKRGSDVRWRWVSVGEKRESAAKQSNELACQCACVTPL
jgi:hypothetical protein